MSASSSAADRWLLLRERAGSALAARPADPADRRALLEQTIELAHLTTIAIALAQGEPGFASFDAAVAQSPALPGPGEVSTGEEDSPTLPRPRRAYRPLTPAGQRQLENNLEKLANSRVNVVHRQSAVRWLANLTSDLADLPPKAADSVAEYLLAKKTDEEHANLLPSIAAMRRWNRLRLAIADRAAESKLTPEQQRLLGGALLDRELTPELAGGEKLRSLLIDSVLRDLDDVASDPGPTLRTDPNKVFDAVAELLLESYRERAKLLGAAAGEYQSAASPAQALAASLGPLADSLRGGSADDAQFLASLADRHQAEKFVAGDDLRMTAATQRLLIELSARLVIRRRPPQAAAARQIDAESMAASGSAENVLEQIRVQEVALLQLWLLYAPEI
jgi:hypothetical protein